MTTAPITDSSAPATVDPREAQRLLKSGAAQLVDVREVDEFRREHVPGAALHPTSCFSVTGFPAPHSGGRTLILCRSGNRATKVTEAMRAAGRTDVCCITGGLAAWSAAGLPVARNAKAPMPLVRQVMIVAGTAIAGFTALGAFVNPWFLAIAGFMGCGLAFAGLTGICPMATVLGKMPWNRASAIVPSANTPAQACSPASGGSCCS